MTSVGLIGAGGIAQDVVIALRDSHPASGVEIVAALVRPGTSAKARGKLPGIEIVETLDDLLARQPTLVAEVAGQSAVADYGERVLRTGVDFLIISVGALAEPKLLARLKAAARDGESRIVLRP